MVVVFKQASKAEDEEETGTDAQKESVEEKESEEGHIRRSQQRRD